MLKLCALTVGIIITPLLVWLAAPTALALAALVVICAPLVAVALVYKQFAPGRTHASIAADADDPMVPLFLSSNDIRLGARPGR